MINNQLDTYVWQNLFPHFLLILLIGYLVWWVDQSKSTDIEKNLTFSLENNPHMPSCKYIQISRNYYFIGVIVNDRIKPNAKLVFSLHSGSSSFWILATSHRKTAIKARRRICWRNTHRCNIYRNSQSSWTCRFLSKQRRPSTWLSTLLVS